MKYLFKKIEPKWQAKWEEAKVFEAKDNSDKPIFQSGGYFQKTSYGRL